MKEQIELCEKWINTIATRTESINRNRTSYGFKHLVETFAGQYISNDSFKKAARNSGLLIEHLAGTENEFYNLSIVNNNF